MVCNPANPEPETIMQAARALVDGQAIVVPTETQYGLAIRADRPDAPEKINRIKRRNETLPVALFVKDVQMGERLCEFSNTAHLLADRFLPGPLTLVLPPRKGRETAAAGFVSAEGIGIRISSSPLVTAIMRKVDFPVTATSANLSGQRTPSTVSEIQKELGDAVTLYLDGGPCRGLIPSTVVRVNGGVHVLRPGVISESEIRMALTEGS